MFGGKDVSPSEESILDQIAKNIQKETDPKKLIDLGKRFQKRQTEKMVQMRKQQTTKPDIESAHEIPKYFWIQTTGTTDENQDLALVKTLAHNMESSTDTEELARSGNRYKFLENKYLKRLEKEKKFRIMNALKFVMQKDKELNIIQKHHTRNTVRDNSFILDLLEERLGSIANIPGTQLIPLITALLDLMVEIFQLPNGENWVWLMQILVMDIIQICEELAKQDQILYNRIVVLLNLMYVIYILVYSNKDMDMCFEMIQLPTKTLQLNKDWEMPTNYAGSLRTCGIKTMNMLEISYSLYYKCIIRMNYCIEHDLDANIFQDTMLRLYKLALIKMKENEAEESVLVLYELVALCHQKNDKFMLGVTYSHLSNCFFTLRNIKTAYVYLELLIVMAREHTIVVFEMLAHKQIGLIASCENKLDISIYHLKVALEKGESNENIKAQLYHEIDNIRICLGEVIARHKLIRGLRVSLDEDYNVDPLCTCTLYLP
ncbi:hypothetical protein WDU94_014115 [Cyamophila willieti]